MSESDDGRASGVSERLTEARLYAVQRGLCDLQAYDAGRRSVATGNDGRGGVPEMTATEAASDDGRLRRASVAYGRLLRVRFGPEHDTLVWLITYAHVGDVGTLARRRAWDANHDLRDRMQSARWVVAQAGEAVKRADTAVLAARRAERATPTAQTLAAKDAAEQAALVARDRAAGAVQREAACDAAMLAWGIGDLARGVDAWERAGRVGEREDDAA